MPLPTLECLLDPFSDTDIKMFVEALKTARAHLAKLDINVDEIDFTPKIQASTIEPMKLLLTPIVGREHFMSYRNQKILLFLGFLPPKLMTLLLVLSRSLFNIPENFRPTMLRAIRQIYKSTQELHDPKNEDLIFDECSAWQLSSHTLTPPNPRNQQHIEWRSINVELQKATKTKATIENTKLRIQAELNILDKKNGHSLLAPFQKKRGRGASVKKIVGEENFDDELNYPASPDVSRILPPTSPQSMSKVEMSILLELSSSPSSSPPRALFPLKPSEEEPTTSADPLTPQRKQLISYRMGGGVSRSVEKATNLSSDPRYRRRNKENLMSEWLGASAPPMPPIQKREVVRDGKIPTFQQNMSTSVVNRFAALPAVDMSKRPVPKGPLPTPGLAVRKALTCVFEEHTEVIPPPASRISITTSASCSSSTLFSLSTTSVASVDPVTPLDSAASGSSSVSPLKIEPTAEIKHIEYIKLGELRNILAAYEVEREAAEVGKNYAVDVKTIHDEIEKLNAKIKQKREVTKAKSSKEEHQQVLQSMPHIVAQLTRLVIHDYPSLGKDDEYLIEMGRIRKCIQVFDRKAIQFNSDYDDLPSWEEGSFKVEDAIFSGLPEDFEPRTPLDHLIVKLHEHFQQPAPESASSPSAVPSPSS